MEKCNAKIIMRQRSRQNIMQITVNEKKETAKLGDLYGIFFEDINHAADGGLYAELVRNRSFEFCEIDNKEYHALTAWERVKWGRMDTDRKSSRAASVSPSHTTCWMSW